MSELFGERIYTQAQWNTLVNEIDKLKKAIELMMAIPVSERREMKRVGREALKSVVRKELRVRVPPPAL